MCGRISLADLTAEDLGFFYGFGDLRDAFWRPCRSGGASRRPPPCPSPLLRQRPPLRPGSLGPAFARTGRGVPAWRTTPSSPPPPSCAGQDSRPARRRGGSCGRAAGWPVPLPVSGGAGSGRRHPREAGRRARVSAEGLKLPGPPGAAGPAVVPQSPQPARAKPSPLRAARTGLSATPPSPQRRTGAGTSAARAARQGAAAARPPTVREGGRGSPPVAPASPAAAGLSSFAASSRTACGAARPAAFASGDSEATRTARLSWVAGTPSSRAAWLIPPLLPRPPFPETGPDWPGFPSSGLGAAFTRSAEISTHFAISSAFSISPSSRRCRFSAISTRAAILASGPQSPLEANPRLSKLSSWSRRSYG